VAARKPRLVLLLSRAQRALSRAVARRTQDQLGVSGAQMGALFFVAGHPGCVQGDVGRELGINKAAASKLVSRMVEAGIVERRSAADDGRALALHVTPRGQAAADAGRPLVRSLNDELTSGFTAADMETVARFLTAVADRFEDPHD